MNWLEIIARRKLEPLKVETVHVLSPKDFEISLCYCIMACLIYHLGRGRIKWRECESYARRFILKNTIKNVTFHISCKRPIKLTLDRKEYYPIFRKVWYCICHLNSMKYKNRSANMKWWDILNTEAEHRAPNSDEELKGLAELLLTQERIEDIYRREGGGCSLYDVDGNLLR